LGGAESTMDKNGPLDRDGEVERFARLIARCQRRVFIYAMSLLHDANDAEDVLQETNLVLWKKFKEYEPGTDFARWACRVAYYEVLKVLRKKGQEGRLLSNKFIETLAAGCERTMCEWDDRREALRHCVGRLNDRDRRLVRSRYQPGATTRSVAEASGRSVQGTRKSLLRIRNALLECVRRTLSSREHP
jgi:RNA polymerase sigma-70 factor (ECF subfamily)